MKIKNETICYIDGANLYKGITSLGWELNYQVFRRWLDQKYAATKVYLFIGMISAHADLYTTLQRCGFTLIFKEVIFYEDGKAKGNCDADLIVRAARDLYESGVRSVILVSSDGDYVPLIKLWREKNTRCIVLSPSKIKNCSILIKRTGVPIVCLDEIKKKLGYSKNKKAPDTGVPA
ncbi:NYN domain-containing protein [Candidatus Uhrbacteria bacterium]|nr:NYN domain-containing protein [Candidatus Uhrbacteria bacterium]